MDIAILFVNRSASVFVSSYFVFARKHLHAACAADAMSATVMDIDARAFQSLEKRFVFASLKNTDTLALMDSEAISVRAFF